MRTSCRLRLGLCAGLLGLAGAVLLSGAPEAKMLSIYSSLANYSIPLIQEHGQDNVGLIELLDPLGTVSAKPDHGNWKLKYNGTELEFAAGKTRVHKHGSDFDLSAPFLLQNGRGFVPTASLLSLLPRVLGGPVAFHDAARRLFIGDAGIHFTAEVQAGTPPKLVLTFTAPVNPTIVSEGGRLRMMFVHDALMGPGTPQLTFGSPVIRSAAFEEMNGSAELDVSSTAALVASFANGNKTLILSVAPTQPANQPSGASSPSVPLSAAISGPRHYFAVIDPSHGGIETGSLLGGDLLEKEVTLALARRLRQALESRGMATLLLRDSDSSLTLDQRAGAANAAHPSIYICVHAASLGSGVRIYTAMLPPAGESRGLFTDWNTAQASFSSASHAVAAAVQAQFQAKQVPVRVMEAPLRPLNNITAAAIGLEAAPPADDIAQLTSVPYQELIASQVAQTLAGMRSQMEAGR